MSSKYQQIQTKVNEAVRLLCDVYDILAEEEDNKETTPDGYNLYTIKQFCEKHKFIRIGKMRWDIHQNKNNINEKVITRAGKKILINEDKYLEWMKECDKGINRDE